MDQRLPTHPGDDPMSCIRVYAQVVMECVTNFLSNQNFNSQKLMEQADFRSCKF